MHRHFIGTLLALLAVGLLAAPSASAGDENAALREEVKQLREKVETLSQQQSAQLGEEVERYLAEQTSSAQGGSDGWYNRMKIWAQLTSVFQATIGLDPSDSHQGTGDADVWFEFTATENLWIIAHMTANTGGNTDGSTAGGFTDGIGVDGTAPVAPGSVTMEEAYAQHRLPVGSNWLWWAVGKIDPRKRYAQTAFTEDEDTQFINNNFDDTPGINWASNAGGVPVAIEMWLTFGEQSQFTLNWGWYNSPGSFFDNGQFLVQGTWTADVSGRQMHIRVYFCYDSINEDAGGDPTYAGGVAWDWMVTEMIGLFARFTYNSFDDLFIGNATDFDVQLGAVFTKLVSSRPSDALGVGFAWLNSNDALDPFAAADREWTFEIYYSFVIEEGKASITPHIQYIMDPGFNLSFSDDSLFIVGVRLNFRF
jgi:hypothetical protein